VRGVLGWIGPAGAEQAAAFLVEGRDIGYGQRADVGVVVIDQVLEPVADADDFESLIDGLDGHRTDDAVDARRGAAADHNAKLAANRVRHGKNALNST